ncbi:hypothetical protein N7L96_12705 [Mammaliicoccus sciuri]|uniref:hypothetical protein n=1 Tax=Mammaliicoccus sciuri TaxID=1296 RepID=UPI001FB25D3A|nr:hypothetical protein [Mammaliicoccus sciuri]MCJ1785171.1 hypothetical protein [Mammaliicoccus sciuri]MDC5695443.1 hypothetical protein [Mammaliicoccus sciuri]
MWLSIIKKTVFNTIEKFIKNRNELKEIYNQLNHAKSNKYAENDKELKSLRDNIKDFRLSARGVLYLSSVGVNEYLSLVQDYNAILKEQIVKDYILKNRKAHLTVDTRIKNINSFITELEKFKRNCDDYSYGSNFYNNTNEFMNLIQSNKKLFDEF